MIPNMKKGVINVPPNIIPGTEHLKLFRPVYAFWWIKFECKLKGHYGVLTRIGQGTYRDKTRPKSCDIKYSMPWAEIKLSNGEYVSVWASRCFHDVEQMTLHLKADAIDNMSQSENHAAAMIKMCQARIDRERQDIKRYNLKIESAAVLLSARQERLRNKHDIASHLKGVEADFYEKA